MTLILSRKHRKRRPLPPLPPGLNSDIAGRIPFDLLEDAVQQAWLAHLAGDNPNRSVWRVVKRERRRRKAVVCFSQLDPAERRRVRNMAQ